MTALPDQHPSLDAPEEVRGDLAHAVGRYLAMADEEENAARNAIHSVNVALVTAYRLRCKAAALSDMLDGFGIEHERVLHPGDAPTPLPEPGLPSMPPGGEPVTQQA